MVKKVMMRLRLATEIEMLEGDPPMVNSPDGPRPMTIGDLFVQIAQSCAQRDEANGMRIWDIGRDMLRTDKKYIDLSRLDYELFHNACKGERGNWAIVNLKNAFDEAKEVGKD